MDFVDSIDIITLANDLNAGPIIDINDKID